MLKYYIYAYIDSQGEPYYIGKGSGRRAFVKHDRNLTPTDKKCIIIMEKNLTEIGAFALERRYIKWYGRLNNNTGILQNKNDGGRGPNNNIISDEKRKNISLSIKKVWESRDYNSKKNISNKVSKSVKKLWEKEDYKNKMKTIRKKQMTEHVKNKLSESNLKYRYVLISPTGEIFETKNLKKFCLDKNLSQPSKLSRVSRGLAKDYRGWTCERFDL